MSLVSRLLLVLLLLGAGWSGIRYLKTRDAKWLRIMRWLPKIFVGVILAIFFWLLVVRCLGY